MKIKQALPRSALIVGSVAIVVGIFLYSEPVHEYMREREWLPDGKPWADLPLSSQIFGFMNKSSPSDLKASLMKIGGSLDIQNWLSDALYSRFTFGSDPTRIGLSLAEKGLKVKHPVIIIPGLHLTRCCCWRMLPCCCQQSKYKD
jgi:hypothetical protein